MIHDGLREISVFDAISETTSPLSCDNVINIATC